MQGGLPSTEGASTPSPGDLPPAMGEDSGVRVTGETFGDASTDGRPSGPACGAPSTPANTDPDAGALATLDPTYGVDYRAYDLGPVPGIPGTLGGCVIKQGDPDMLLIAGNSERTDGALYSIKVKREPCGHIVGWDGTATKVMDAPYIDANVVYGPNGVLFWTQWPQYKLSQLGPNLAGPPVDTNLQSLGMAGGGAGGFGFVPPALPGGGGARFLTWPGGFWYRTGLTTNGTNTYGLGSLTQTQTLENGPGGFAYVPAGSPGFTKQSLIVAEWSKDTVATYEVDDQGDPLPATRKPFFTAFPRPWGAYFEPVTGDFMFLTWGSAPERVFIVQGFAPPPPPPPPPR